MDSCPLPLEVVDLIITELHFDLPALKACSLVCRSWIPSCRIHLFRHLQLRPTGRGSPENWNAFLSNSVDIIPYIAEISIFCERSSWVSWDPVLPTLLGKLQNIEQIELHGCDLPWLPTPFTSAIYTLFRSPSMQRVTLGFCVLPSSFADLFGSGLNSLVLSNVTLEPDTMALAAKPSRPPRPKHLSIEGKSVSNVVDWLISSEGNELEDLQHLAIKYSGDNESALEAVERILQCASDLKTLDMCLYPASLQSTSSLCAAPSTCYNRWLSELRLAHFDMDTSSPTNQLPWLASLLARMTPQHMVRKITVDARLRPLPGRPTLDCDGWANVDDLLVRIGSVHLQEVHIHTGEAYGESMAQISASMPGLRAKGILRVTM
ncbi:hypothetical protein B0H11DRAFT_1958637 [Mycena galericulata]|nr:hypothetical protein B0H11DRAFT_1958637 [Mycena galericulata]